MERHLESVSRVIPLLLREQMLRAKSATTTTTVHTTGSDFHRSTITTTTVTMSVDPNEMRGALERYVTAITAFACRAFIVLQQSILTVSLASRRCRFEQELGKLEALVEIPRAVERLFVGE
jgi:hypothetical protein